jgi:hypothetical protein
MTEQNQNEMRCSQFEALLADVLDYSNAGAGTLSEETRREFQAHAASCAACGPILSEAREGMLLLRALEEPDPPKNLVHNILSATSAAEAAKESAQPEASKVAWIVRLWKPVRGVLAGAIQPRFATSFSMAFFSLSLTLTLAGVRLKDLAHVDWHPSAVGKAVVLQYTQVESKVVRYYNNMRLVYEIESRVSELKKNSGSEQNKQQPSQQPKEDKKKKDNNDTSGRPEHRQDNYSQDLGHTVVAYLRLNHEGA